jgi:hypothetical protein
MHRVYKSNLRRPEVGGKTLYVNAQGLWEQLSEAKSWEVKPCVLTHRVYRSNLARLKVGR